MTVPVRHVLVVVPARNEAETLSACLSSIIGACAAVTGGTAVTATIVLVLDDCTDASASIAEHFPEVVTLTGDYANVGRARGRGIVDGLRLIDDDPAAVWIATTDADSTVPASWLAPHLHAARAGAQAFIGAVVPVLERLDPVRRGVWLRTHSAGSTLGHVHGANLGVRADAYLRAGGFVAATGDEDIDLVRRLREQRFTIAESEDAPVVTSSRLVGRVEGGYARYLADLADLAGLAGLADLAPDVA